MAKVIIWGKDRDDPIKVIDTDAPNNYRNDAEYEKIKKSLLISTLKKTL